MLRVGQLKHIEVAYEDLVADPAQFDRVRAFLGVSADEGVPESNILKTRTAASSRSSRTTTTCARAAGNEVRSPPRLRPSAAGRQRLEPTREVPVDELLEPENVIAVEVEQLSAEVGREARSGAEVALAKALGGPLQTRWQDCLHRADHAGW